MRISVLKLFLIHNGVMNAIEGSGTVLKHLAVQVTIRPFKNKGNCLGVGASATEELLAPAKLSSRRNRSEHARKRSNLQSTRHSVLSELRRAFVKVHTHLLSICIDLDNRASMFERIKLQGFPGCLHADGTAHFAAPVR